MTHHSIQCKNLSLHFPHKTCFEDFNQSVLAGHRIAIIGKNGSGKSTLLQMLVGLCKLQEGEIRITEGEQVAYIPQIIEDFPELSGGERFNKMLTQVLSLSPSILLLDEPTNHLDAHNRRSLMRMLKAFQGTLIIVTHDVAILQNIVDILWHVDGNIEVFQGNYADYLQNIQTKRAGIEEERARLTHKKIEMHESLMQEQKRAKNSRLAGEKHIQQRKWPTVVSKSKMGNSQETSGRKKQTMILKKESLNAQLAELYLPEIIKPTFSLIANENNRLLISVRNGAINYSDEKMVLSGLEISLQAKSRIALCGNNGSGKSTFIKALLSDNAVKRQGLWEVLNPCDIGYLDQHYLNLLNRKTVLENLEALQLGWSYQKLRDHLNDFLFRKNEEINALVTTLSGGERARLSLAIIAAKPPRLLILDEMTNNVDLETRNHIIEVLKIYPGAMIIISHDEDFLKNIGIEIYYNFSGGRMQQVYQTG